MQIGQVVDLVSVSVGNEVGEKHCIKVILKRIVPDQAVQRLKLVILLGLGAVSQPMGV